MKNLVWLLALPAIVFFIRGWLWVFGLVPDLSAAQGFIGSLMAFGNIFAVIILRDFLDGL